MRFATDLFRGERYAVVGLGRNGLPVARALVAMGADVTAWDDSADARDAALGLTVADPDMAGLSALVLSPGIPHALPAPHPVAARALAASVPILSDADLLFRAVRRSGSAARFVGITGTNGKSTTTALLAHILAAAGMAVAAGGNLGTPALALPLLPPDGVYVLEMSSYMLERLGALRFDAAVMLNLSPDHLDRHGDMEGYAAAKRAVFDRQTAGDLALVGERDWLSVPRARLIGAEPDAGPALPGAHNAQNAAAARATAQFLGVADPVITAAMRSFPGLPHRQELVGTIGGVAFVNDSKATNADSTARALACHDRIVWIAGGIAKAGGIEPLAAWFPRIVRALLIGRDAALLADTLAANDVAHDIIGTLDAAVPAARAIARPGDTVLLSPACASFDQFTGFEQRGDRFRALVHGLREAA